jgi:hypothetical protein
VAVASAKAAVRRDALTILDRIRQAPVESGPVRLAPEYLRAVRYLEDLPENRDGADKTWVYRAQRDFRDYFAKIKPSR